MLAAHDEAASVLALARPVSRLLARRGVVTESVGKVGQGRLAMRVPGFPKNALQPHEFPRFLLFSPCTHPTDGNGR